MQSWANDPSFTWLDELYTMFFTLGERTFVYVVGRSSSFGLTRWHVFGVVRYHVLGVTRCHVIGLMEWSGGTFSVLGTRYTIYDMDWVIKLPVLWIWLQMAFCNWNKLNTCSLDDLQWPSIWYQALGFRGRDSFRISGSRFGLDFSNLLDTTPCYVPTRSLATQMRFNLYTEAYLYSC